MRIIITRATIGLLILCCFWGTTAFAQEESDSKIELKSGFDLVSRYHWRGLVLSPGMAIQPGLEATSGGFTLGAWGSTTLQPFEWQEVDMYLSYAWKDFSISVNDYFYYNDTITDPGFFDYRRDHTGHVLELMAKFNGSEKIPFRLVGAYNFYGNDPSNSFYFEMAWMKTIKDIDFEIFSGFTPQKGYYDESKNGFTNFGIRMTRNLEISKTIRMPLDMAWVYNPLSGKTFIVTSIGLK